MTSIKLNVYVFALLILSIQSLQGASVPKPDGGSCKEKGNKYTISSKDCTCFHQMDIGNGNYGYHVCPDDLKFNIETCVCDRPSEVKCDQPASFDRCPKKGADVDTDKAKIDQVVRAINTFSADLTTVLRNKTGNVVFSAGSISVILAMLYEGSRGNTRSQIGAVAHFDKVRPDVKSSIRALILGITSAMENVTLKTANRVYPSSNHVFLESYLKAIREYFLSVVVPLDYQTNPEKARQTINSWVEENTENLIKDLIPRGVITGSTVMVLVNALYFKGFWEKPFNASLTTRQKFYPEAGRHVFVDTMIQEGTFNYSSTSKYQVLHLPYVGGRFEMVIVLPSNPRTSLGEIEEGFKDATRSIGLMERRVEVYLPKFKVETKFDMKKTLSKMGMPDLFSAGACDLSGMDGTRSLFVSSFIHQAVVIVNEEGTEAAAATAAVVTKSKPVVFNANRPFVFMIHDVVSGTILFTGRVVEP